MIYRFSFLILILVLEFSCQNKAFHCKQTVNNLINNIESSDFDHLYGFSAESTWRLKDVNGNRRVSRIMYSDKYNERFNIPSFQVFEGQDIKFDTLIDIIKFAKEIGLSNDNNFNEVKKYANDIIVLLNKYNLKGISSQKHLGDFMEFNIETGCSVWYKKDGVKLNDGYGKLFKNAYRIKPNWYILRYNNESIDLIDQYAQKEK